MTIDEAIVSLRKSASKSLDYEWQREQYQIAKWLELLKWYEQGMEDIPSESGVLPKDVYHAGYNKAIDEVICKVEEHKTKGYVTGITNSPFEFGACQMADDIVKILEQLKRSLG